MPKKNETASQRQGPRLLAGGNPQIPKGDGDAPVQAYIDAMPGWKSDVGRHLDALIEQAVSHVVKAVKWNQPMYGVEDQGFFASFRCYTKYVKITFFRGAELDPVPPVDFRDPNEKAFHIHEDDDIDDEQLISWFEQAAAIPGWTP